MINEFSEADLTEEDWLADVLVNGKGKMMGYKDDWILITNESLISGDLIFMYKKIMTLFGEVFEHNYRWQTFEEWRARMIKERKHVETR